MFIERGAGDRLEAQGERKECLLMESIRRMQERVPLLQSLHFINIKYPPRFYLMLFSFNSHSSYFSATVLLNELRVTVL